MEQLVLNLSPFLQELRTVTLDFGVLIFMENVITRKARNPGLFHTGCAVCVCLNYCSTYYKAVRVGGRDSGGHVL
jgi:hypothetical protein